MKPSMVFHYGHISSSRGECWVIASDRGVCWVGTPGTPLDTGKAYIKKHVGASQFIEGSNAHLDRALIELERYLKGKPVTFSIEFDLYGTEFQKSVWNAIFNIPYGTTMSYKDLAIQVRRPTSFRAVANACGANPVALIIPCHRVVGSHGYFGGYGGGLAVKQSLLALEHLHQT